MAEKIIFQIEIDNGKSVQTFTQLKTELSRLKTEFANAKFGSAEFNALGASIKNVEAQTKALNNSFKESNQIIPGSIGAIKQEIKELQDVLDKSIPGTREFDQALKALGKNKNELKTVNDNIKALGGSTQDSVRQIAALGQSVAGAFGIAASSAVLFGNENKELAESLAKVQASMNLLQSIESLAGSKDAANIVRKIFLFSSYKKTIDDSTTATKVNTTATQAGAAATNVQSTAQKSAVVSAKLLKNALMGIPILLLVGGITELINRWDDVKKLFSNITVFKKVGDAFDEIKERTIGSLYAIGNSIRPIGQLIKTYFITPFELLVGSVKAVGQALSDPFNLANLKASATQLGNVFTGAKDKIVKDVKAVGTAFTQGFDKGVSIQKAREAAEARKEFIEKEIKDLEQSIQFIKEGSKKRLDAELELVNLKLKISKKGSEDYKKLLVDQFKAQEAVKDFNSAAELKAVETREKALAEAEKKIKEKYALLNSQIEVNASVQINEVRTNNPAPEQAAIVDNTIETIEQVKDIQITKNNLDQLNERKANYEKFKQDVSQILVEIGQAEQNLISQTAALNKSLADNSFNQDTANTQKYVDEQTAIIKAGQLDQLKALEEKNLTSEQLVLAQAKIEKDTQKQIADLTRERFKQDIQSRMDAGLSASDLIIAQTDFEISENQRLLDDKKNKLSEEAAAKAAIRQQEDEVLAQGFEAFNALTEAQNDIQLSSLNNKLNKEKAAIDAKVKAGVLSEEAAAKKKTEIDAKFEKEKRKIERDAAISRKITSVAQVGINTAIAISRAYSDTGPIAGNAFAVLVGIIGAAQIASILAQPLPPLAKGGIPIPNSKDQQIINVGGKSVDDVLAISPEGQPVAMVNKGEGIVSEPTMRKYGHIISEMSFASGGNRFPGYRLSGIPIPGSSSSTIINNNTDAGLSESFLNELKSIKEELRIPKKNYVVESEISYSQQSVKRIEERNVF